MVSIAFCSSSSTLLSHPTRQASASAIRSTTFYSRRHNVFQFYQPKKSTKIARYAVYNIISSSKDTTTTVPLSLTSTTEKNNLKETFTRDIHAESLSLLEWPELSQHVLRYATSDLGRLSLTNGKSSLLYIPSTQEESEKLLAQTREVYNLEYNLNKPLPISGVSNIIEIAQLAAKGKLLSGKELLSISSTLFSALAVRKHLDALPNPDSFPSLISLTAEMRTCAEAAREIRAHLDDFGDVEASADPELRSIRNDIRQVVSDIRSALNTLMSRNPDSVQERLITSRYDRLVIPVKVTRKSDFRRAIVHDTSASGGTAYIEPASVRPLNDRVRMLTAKERARVNAILRKLCEKYVVPNADAIVEAARILGDLDAAVARARCSRSLHAVDVVFDNEKPLRLLGARHPLLVWNEMAKERAIADEESSKEDEGENKNINTRDQMDEKIRRFKITSEPVWKKNVVPSSYELNERIRCVCVTGPNTGGKTLSLKTLGVCVLMAKAGLFVPSTIPKLLSDDDNFIDNEEYRRARIPFFDHVLADIGDDQSLVQSLSTFSGHVQRIKRIIAASTPQSLVLLDEIGSGTDPAEGAALGMAILRHLAVGERASLTFATTHHGELKTLKYGNDDTARFFENACVEFDDVKMAPTFKLVWGIPGRSNALAIASRLGMDETVVSEAKLLLNGSNELEGENSKRVDFDKMISSLEHDKNAAQTAREKAERSMKQIEGMRAELEDRLDRLRVSENSLRKEQKAAMNEEVKEAKKQIGRVIKEMQRGGGSAQAASKATEKLEKLTLPGGGPNIQKRNKKVTSDEIKVGDRVFVPRLGNSGVEVVEKKSDKEIVVAVGPMRAQIKIKEVTNVTVKSKRTNQEEEMTPKQVENKLPQNSKRLHIRTAANTVDIRGQRVEGAQASVEKALDKALAMGVVWIIHGHGTGRLRTGIREYLKQHSLVQRIEDAEQADGGTGVTIAYLA